MYLRLQISPFFSEHLIKINNNSYDFATFSLFFIVFDDDFLVFGEKNLH